MTNANPIKGLHHAAYRCRDSEITRQFYEDFLGLPLANAFEINLTQSGRATSVLHSFFEMADGSFLAFFEDPATPFDFKDQRDFDLHIALEVERDTLEQKFAAGKSSGLETRGISDHGFIHSIYFRDPNGYVIELTAKVQDTGDDAADEQSGEPAQARQALNRWQAQKS